MDRKIDLKTFIKRYTAINQKFIDEYYNFYELCDKKRFGINIELVIKYLGIKNSEKFYKQLRDKYIEDQDYIKEINIIDELLPLKGEESDQYLRVLSFRVEHY